MSNVTSVIVMADLDTLFDAERTETPAFAQVQAWLRDLGQRPFPCIDALDNKTYGMVVGGSKALQGDVVIGAFNHLPDDDFINAFRRAPWTATVLLCYLLEHDDAWQVERIHAATAKE
jgi:hypothetical protein